MQNSKKLAGFRDFYGEEIAIRQRVVGILRTIFEKYGFQPLETPSVEYAETLLGKYGAEADRLVYTFADRGGRRVGLRYDLTVPVCRFLSEFVGRLSLPFKRYQIQSVWRAEKPQKGRYREFTQCDIDTFGSNSPLADAEIVAVIYESLKALNFSEFTIKINSRQVLFRLLEECGIQEKNKQLEILRIIDKLDKKSRSEIESELNQIGLSGADIKTIFMAIAMAKPDETLEKIFAYLQILGVDEKFYRFSPTLVRGLDYYTGPIFETLVKKPKIGSVTGGGRYDKLVAQLGGPDLPATGTTIGLDRICEVIKEQNLWPNLSQTATRALVTIFSPELMKNSLNIAAQTRRAGLATEIYFDSTAKLDKQLKYADAKGIPYAIILGPKEAAANLVTLKNLSEKTQKTMTADEAIKTIGRATND